MTHSVGAMPQEGHEYFAPAPDVSPRPQPRPGHQHAAAGRPGPPGRVTPQTSRWAKSDTTFGPVGRVVTTVVLVLPLAFFVAAGLFTADPLVLGGAVLWAGIMWTGLRHVWQPVRRR